MIFTFEERPESRQQTMNPPSQTRVYKAVGEASDSTVAAYALAGTPSSIFTSQGTLYRQDIRLDPDGFAQYVVTVPYGPSQRQTGSYTFSFDTTGGTVNVKASKEHIASFPAGAPANQHSGAIGVKGDSSGDVEGCDIVIPALRFSVAFTHAQGVVTLAYMKSLADITGTTNDGSFLGFAAGELLFLGASGSDGSEAEATITYQFQASANVTGLSIGGISIDKKGFEYAWVQFASTVEDDKPAMQPERVHVERVYDEADWPAIFGWS